MTETENENGAELNDTTGPSLTRRGFVGAAGAAGAGAVGMKTGLIDPPVGSAEAVAPVVVGAAVVGAGGLGALTGGVAGYVLAPDEADIDGLEDYSGRDAVRVQGWEMTRALRRGDERSLTYVLNAVDLLENAAWLEGKIAGVEAINDGDSTSDVIDAAHYELHELYSEPLDELANHYTQSMETAARLAIQEVEHDDLDDEDLVRALTTVEFLNRPDEDDEEEVDDWSVEDCFTGYEEYELPNGDVVEVPYVLNEESNYDDTSVSFEPRDTGYGTDSREGFAVLMSGVDSEDLDSVPLLAFDGVVNEFIDAVEDSEESYTIYDWEDWFDAEHGEDYEDHYEIGYESPAPEMRFQVLRHHIEEKVAELENEFSSYFDDLVDAVSSGEVELTDAVSAYEIAEMVDEEGVSRRAAELISMGVGVDDFGRSTIEISDTGAELDGLLLYTGTDTFDVDEEIDPDQEDGSFFFSYDRAAGWITIGDDRYSETIDGGDLVIEDENLAEDDGMRYEVHTNHDETVEFGAGDIPDEYDADAEGYVVDLSDDLDDDHAEVEELNGYWDPDEGDSADRYELLLLHEERFTVTDHVVDGAKMDVVEFESTNVQSTDVDDVNEDVERLRDAEEGMDEFDVSISGGFGPGWSMSDFGMHHYAAGGVAVVVIVGAFLKDLLPWT